MPNNDFKMTKLTIRPDNMTNLLTDIIGKISRDTIDDLKHTSPVDDTTPEKAKYIYAQTGKRAWIMDGIESRLYWEFDGTSKTREGLTSFLQNANPAVISLALGFIFEEENIESDPVERTKDGLYSEQDPKGMYALESIARAFALNGIKYIKIKK